jgi:hypothetical protein
MEKNRQRAQSFEFERMFFHACDIEDYAHNGRPDRVYSLHACDSATDKTLSLGLRTEARNILSVSCCQHTIMKKMRRHPYTGITRHQVFKKKLVYMVGDSLRAMLLEMQGYQVDIIEFSSIRYTDKNIMLRAKIGQTRNLDKPTINPKCSNRLSISALLLKSISRRVLLNINTDYYFQVSSATAESDKRGKLRAFSTRPHLFACEIGNPSLLGSENYKILLFELRVPFRRIKSI